MKPPKVSVLIPTYNYARYLPEAIESVLEQDFQDFEILIVDDASKDNSAEVIKRYAEKDNRIRFQINSPNVGMVQNWNLSMEMARGDYLKFLFGDDKLCSRHSLGKMSALLDENEKVSLVSSARSILNENSKAIDVWAHLGKSGVKPGIDVIMQCLKEIKNVVGEPSAVMFRKKDATRGFDLRYRQIVDLEFWFHLLRNGDLSYTDEPLCAFRTHSAQQTAVNRAQQIGEKEHLLLVSTYLNLLPVQERLNQKILFNNLYHIKKNRGAEPASDLEKELFNRLGSASYWCHWVCFRVTRPFANLKRSLEKRLRRAAVRKL